MVGVVTIKGHTDNIGTKEYNQKLSEKRAKAIAVILEKKLQGKMEEIKIVSKGLGEENPLYPNDSKENRRKNRNVQVKWNLK